MYELMRNGVGGGERLCPQFPPTPPSRYSTATLSAGQASRSAFIVSYLREREGERMTFVSPSRFPRLQSSFNFSGSESGPRYSPFSIIIALSAFIFLYLREREGEQSFPISPSRFPRLPSSESKRETRAGRSRNNPAFLAGHFFANHQEREGERECEGNECSLSPPRAFDFFGDDHGPLRYLS